MFFSLELLLLSLPFITSYVVAQSTPLKFLYPVPGKFNYEFVDGDKAIVEWTPRIQLSEVLLNCSSSAIFNGATDSEVEFLNAKSGVLYHVRQTEDDGDSRFCTFCAGPDSQTCSGVFRLTPRTKGLVPKVWTLDGNSTNLPSRSSRKTSSTLSPSTSSFRSSTIIPTSSRNTSSSYPTLRPSSANSTTSSSPKPTGLLPYGSRNSSAPSWNLTSLPPSFSMPTTTPLQTPLPTLILVDTASSPSAKGPYTTITASLQGWNATAFNANGNGATTIVISVTPSTRPPPNAGLPTASIVALPSATPTRSAGWRTSVDFMMVGLGMLAVGVFVCL